MKLTKHFEVPKRRPFHGWAGVIIDWPKESPPKINFGTWMREQCSVTFECVPFQLCMFGANCKEMHSRDKFTQFAFAGLGTDGALVLQPLPEGKDARDVFEVGSWTPPDVNDMVNRVNSASISKLESMSPAIDLENEFYTLMLECANGFGMCLGTRPNELKFLNVLSSWPVLAPLHKAFLALRAKHAQLVKENQTASLEARKFRLNEVLAEMRLDNLEITSVAAASRILCFELTADSPIPHKVKDAARRLRRDFGNYFPEET